MQHPPIPKRIPALTWRKPAFLWTPLALALAIGWPYVAFEEGDVARTLLIVGAVVFALALTTLGLAWLFGRAPRTRREVVLHVLVAGAVAALASPYLLTRLLGAVKEGEAFTLPMALSVTPLAIVIGLPLALISGIAFAALALHRPKPSRAERDDARFEVQPFR